MNGSTGPRKTKDPGSHPQPPWKTASVRNGRTPGAGSRSFEPDPETYAMEPTDTPSPSPRILVVGASAAGLRAAARARRRLPRARVRVFDASSFISYAACGLPYFLSGDIEDRDRLRETPYGRVRDPAFFRKAKGIEISIRTRVERIDREARKVYARSLEDGKESVFEYDYLVLATGARPVIPPGIQESGPRIKTFKRMEDALALRQALQKGEIGRVCIVGAGYVGCELAEAFTALWGAEAVLVEAADTILPRVLDPEAARAVERYLEEEGIEVHTACPVQAVTEQGEGVRVRAGSLEIEADIAVVGVGVKPDTDLAVACGLDTGETGGIRVDEWMRTSDPRIFAAGDCVEVRHLLTGMPCLMPLGSLANRQGRVVGSNLSGGGETFGPVTGATAVKVLDLNVAATGLTETAARAAGLDAACAWGTFTDRADYFPGAENIHLKLVFEKGTERLLGLQGYGKGEVVKRVDVFTALLQRGGKLEDLLRAEFAYAPPYAPAVDPLFSLGAAALNAARDGVHPIPPDSPVGDRRVLDVRSPGEVEAEPCLEGEVLAIPFEELRERGEAVPKDRPIMVLCEKGLRSAETMRILGEFGIRDAVYLGGGMRMRPRPTPEK